jgi:hypothetical protein
LSSIILEANCEVKRSWKAQSSELILVNLMIGPDTPTGPSLGKVYVLSAVIHVQEGFYDVWSLMRLEDEFGVLQGPETNRGFEAISQPLRHHQIDSS